MDQKRVFLSYSWDDTEAVNRLDNLFRRFNITVTRDIRDLEYNSNIHHFMDQIRVHDKVILYISEAYLKSINCMYEASQAFNMPNSIIIIIKKGTKLFTLSDKENFINYWREKYVEVCSKNQVNFKREIEDTKIAYDSIASFIDFIKCKNRMNDDSFDFDALLDCLQIEKKYPEIVTRPVFDWISKYSEVKLLDILSLINDLYRSSFVVISEYPNIPDDEKRYLFKRIQFAPNMNGINLIIILTDAKNGREIPIEYSRLIYIEENNMRSTIHSKFYFHCENADKKQKYTELRSREKYQGFNSLTEEDQDLLSSGYNDVYRITIYFG